MKIYKAVGRRLAGVIWLSAGLTLSTLLIFPIECRNGATNGIFLCIQVLIPSLLPFLILSGFIAKSGILSYTPKFFGKLSKALFGLPKVSLSIILLSVIGGYPIGACGIKALYKDKLITRDQAKRMSLYCVSGGPGFLVTYIGAVMTRDLRIGYILFASQTLSVFILGIVARFMVKISDEQCIEPKLVPTLNIKSALVESVNNAINSSLKISVLVIIFGSVTEIFLTLTAQNPKLEVLVGLLEITNGIKVTADKYPLPLISFLCGFGGLCVHFQIFSQLGEIGISKSLFYIFRTAQAILCGLITQILIIFFPVTCDVFSTVSKAKAEFKTGITGSVFLFITCIGFMISVKSLKSTNNKSKA